MNGTISNSPQINLFGFISTIDMIILMFIIELLFIPRGKETLFTFGDPEIFTCFDFLPSFWIVFLGHLV